MLNIKVDRFSLLIFVSIFTAMQNVTADEALAKSSNCMACHSVDNKIIGPAFKDIAVKYKSDESAISTLTEKVKIGGSGVWGEMPMPPNTAVSDADIDTLVKWILSL